MLRTGSQYVQKTELFDYRLVSTLGLTQEDADYFAGLDGVRAAEGAWSVDLTAEFEDEGMTLKALTLSDAVNRPSLTAGRMPERADECLADADRFTEADLGKNAHGAGRVRGRCVHADGLHHRRPCGNTAVSRRGARY